jgi:hypothetical protein
MIKILSLLVSMLALGVLSAQEVKMPQIQVEWRLDTVKEHTDEVSDVDGNKKEFKFTIPYLRFGIKGKYDDTISYRVRFRLNKTLAQATGRKDETGEGVDYAYIDKIISPNLKLQIGKQVLYHGGWEAVVSSKEEYSYSYNSFSMYSVGVGAFIKAAGQNVILQVLNSGGSGPNDVTTTNKLTSATEENQTLPMMGGQWSTSLFEGMINPIFSYHFETIENRPSAAGTTLKQKADQSYLAVGNRFQISDITFDTDYLVNKNESTIIGNKESTDSGYSLRLAYQTGLWRPQIKYTTTENETNGVKVSDISSYHAALEFYPVNDANLRYHLAYVVNEIDFVSGTDTKNSQYVLGMAGTF